MSDFDDRIREALGEDDRALLAELGGERSLAGQVGETFRGRQAWLVALVWLAVTGWSVLAGVSAWKFFSVSGADAQLPWVLGLVLSFIAIAMLKIWYWMELNKNALRREIKRLELQVAALRNPREE